MVSINCNNVLYKYKPHILKIRYDCSLPMIPKLKTDKLDITFLSFSIENFIHLYFNPP